MTSFAGLKNRALDGCSYIDLPFSYPQRYNAAQYVAMWYNFGGTDLTSSFFEHLFTNARSLLTKHPEYAKLILAALEK